MDVKVNPKVIYIGISIVIAIIICAASFYYLNSKLPVCDSMSDIEKYDGEKVILRGTYVYENTTKCWIAFIELGDQTKVVYQYQPSPHDANDWNNSYLEIIGTILSSYPETIPLTQQYTGPHIIGIESIKHITE